MRPWVFPSLERRGGCANWEKTPFRSGADGVVIMDKCFETDHPVPRLSSEASRHFIDGASTLLFQEGNTQVRY